MYVPVVTLSTKDNVNLTKKLDEGFKKPVYWNEYKSQIEAKEVNDQILTRFFLDASFQGVNRLFVLTLTIVFLLITMVVLTELKETIIESIFFQE